MLRWKRLELPKSLLKEGLSGYYSLKVLLFSRGDRGVQPGSGNIPAGLVRISDNNFFTTRSFDIDKT